MAVVHLFLFCCLLIKLPLLYETILFFLFGSSVLVLWASCFWGDLPHVFKITFNLPFYYLYAPCMKLALLICIYPCIVLKSHFSSSSSSSITSPCCLVLHFIIWKQIICLIILALDSGTHNFTSQKIQFIIYWGDCAGNLHNGKIWYFVQIYFETCNTVEKRTTWLVYIILVPIFFSW